MSIFQKMKNNVLQEEDGGAGKCMIDRGLRGVMN
ncbi:helicase subunit [Enterobacter mori]|nr:helicase subunit [Enterobacter mori]